MLRVALVALAVSASAGPIFNFSGTCSDCNGGNPSNPATATLVLTDNGATLSLSDFVSFTYNGTDLLPPFTLLASDPSLSVSGSIPNSLPGPATVNISEGFSWTVTTDSLGNWNICNSPLCVLGDTGSAATWSGTAAPEPNTIALLGAALLALLIFRRRMLKTSR
jgi:PEP-CTERM motif